MKLTVPGLREMKRSGEKIACMTAYDASFARLLERGGVEVLLVGDSLGMVVQGHETTLEVRMADMVYHCRNVRCGAREALIVADLPFMGYAKPAQALGNAARLMSEGGAHMVKLEGGSWLTDTVAGLTERGIPVCAHLGLLPQSIHKLGGYRVQGREADTARRILADARALEAAGASMLVLECVPRSLAAEVSLALDIPVIGIGSGPACDGQVLVVYDALGISPASPRFSRNFLAGAGDLQTAIEGYVAAVKSGDFPAPEHSTD